VCVCVCVCVYVCVEALCELVATHLGGAEVCVCVCVSVCVCVHLYTMKRFLMNTHIRTHIHRNHQQRKGREKEEKERRPSK
jgi:hypothetical protein